MPLEAHAVRPDQQVAAVGQVSEPAGDQLPRVLGQRLALSIRLGRRAEATGLQVSSDCGVVG